MLFEIPSCIICTSVLARDCSALTQCGHVFHTECIKQWLDAVQGRVRRAGGSDWQKCPMCRVEFNSKTTVVLQIAFDAGSPASAKNSCSQSASSASDILRIAKINSDLLRVLQEAKTLSQRVEELTKQLATLRSQLAVVSSEKEKSEVELSRIVTDHNRIKVTNKVLKQKNEEQRTKLKALTEVAVVSAYEGNPENKSALENLRALVASQKDATAVLEQMHKAHVRVVSSNKALKKEVSDWKLGCEKYRTNYYKMLEQGDTKSNPRNDGGPVRRRKRHHPCHDAELRQLMRSFMRPEDSLTSSEANTAGGSTNYGNAANKPSLQRSPEVALPNRTSLRDSSFDLGWMGSLRSDVPTDDSDRQVTAPQQQHLRTAKGTAELCSAEDASRALPTVPRFKARGRAYDVIDVDNDLDDVTAVFETTPAPLSQSNTISATNTTTTTGRSALTTTVAPDTSSTSISSIPGTYRTTIQIDGITAECDNNTTEGQRRGDELSECQSVMSSANGSTASAQGIGACEVMMPSGSNSKPATSASDTPMSGVTRAAESSQPMPSNSAATAVALPRAPSDFLGAFLSSVESDYNPVNMQSIHDTSSGLRDESSLQKVLKFQKNVWFLFRPLLIHSTLCILFGLLLM
eukprot:Lankesteria_metandrocarpae@DN4796_c0_g1_i2.p1